MLHTIGQLDRLHRFDVNAQELEIGLHIFCATVLPFLQYKWQ